jgi:hypothetical protein
MSPVPHVSRLGVSARTECIVWEQFDAMNATMETFVTVEPTTETYSAERATAIHEAGHAVMAYLLHRPFSSMTVVANDESLGHVAHAPPGNWFSPDIEFTGRIRDRIGDYVMISLVGAETEAHWTARSLARPDDWKERVRIGAEHDRQSANSLATFVCGGADETSAYIEWLRQRVLNYVGRLDADISETEHPKVARSMRYGDDQFWRLVHVLADSAQASGTLSWRRARAVLRASDQRFPDERAKSWRVYAATTEQSP